MLYGILMTPVTTRYGRLSKKPERLEPDEEVIDDYSDEDDDDYSDDSDAEDLCETDDEDEDEDDEDEDENGNLKGFVVYDDDDEDEEEDA